MKIQLAAATRPPLFRFVSDDGNPVSVVEIRITEVGETHPVWWLVQRDSWLDEAIAGNILTAEEAERAGETVTRSMGPSLENLNLALGVRVGDLRYGDVPEGLRQHGMLHELKPNRLYQLVATGTTVGELEFYG